MNWIGGNLQRHSKSSTNKAAQRNGRPLYEARRNDLGRQWPSSSRTPSFSPSTQARQTHSRYTPNKRQRTITIQEGSLNTLNANYKHKDEEEVNAFDQTSEHFQPVRPLVYSDKDTRKRRSTLLVAASQPGFKAILPAIATVNGVRQKLLNKPNWIGLPSSKPPRLLMIPNSNQEKVGRRRKVKNFPPFYPIAQSSAYSRSCPTLQSPDQYVPDLYSHQQLPGPSSGNLSALPHPFQSIEGLGFADPIRNSKTNSQNITSNLEYVESGLTATTASDTDQAQEQPSLAELRRLDSFDSISSQPQLQGSTDENRSKNYDRHHCFNSYASQHDSVNQIARKCQPFPAEFKYMDSPSSHTVAQSSSRMLPRTTSSYNKANILQEKFDAQADLPASSQALVINSRQVSHENDYNNSSTRSDTHNYRTEQTLFSDSAITRVPFQFEATPARYPARSQFWHRPQWSQSGSDSIFRSTRLYHQPQLFSSANSTTAHQHQSSAFKLPVAKSSLSSGTSLQSTEHNSDSKQPQSTPRTLHTPEDACMVTPNQFNPSRQIPETLTYSSDLSPSYQNESHLESRLRNNRWHTGMSPELYIADAEPYRESLLSTAALGYGIRSPRRDNSDSGLHLHQSFVFESPRR